MPEITNVNSNEGISIRLASLEDLPIISGVYASAREYMFREGNKSQWSGGYPWDWQLWGNIEKRQLYVITLRGEICAAFVFIIGEDPTYINIEEGAWLNSEPYGTIHRIAGNGVIKNVFSRCLDFCLGQIKNIRIDTHADNKTMLRLLERHNFKRCGTIYIHDASGPHSPRLAFQINPQLKAD
jgi:RimJ/RimL family protein N-acetyltransferase